MAGVLSSRSLPAASGVNAMALTETTITGSTAAQNLSQGAPAVLYAVRVGGTANLAGTITLSETQPSVTVKETIPIAATPGTQREHYGAVINGLRITLSNAADTAIVIWGPA
jgi:hypothetical protein